MAPSRRIVPPRLAATLGVLAALFILGGSPVAAGDCWVLTVDEPVVLPDGSVGAGPALSLCLDRDYNPVAGLHTVRVGRGSPAMFVSRMGTSEAVVRRPAFALFYRDRLGRLVLQGYAVPEGRNFRTFVLATRPSAVEEMRRVVAGSGRVDEVVRVAARR